jgi:diketogulonate reductase-like aldo/keto reductase
MRIKDRENIIRSSYPHPINLSYGYRSVKTSVVYAEAEVTRGEAITTYVVKEDVIVTSRFEGDDIPPGKTE